MSLLICLYIMSSTAFLQAETPTKLQVEGFTETATAAYCKFVSGQCAAAKKLKT